MNWPKIKTFIFRFNLLWVLVYLIFAGAIFTYAQDMISNHEENKLPSGYIELKLNKSEYQLGELIEFQVINHFPVNIYVINQCPSEPLNVFRWQNEKWLQIHDKVNNPDSKCYQEPRSILISSEGSREYNFDEWKNLFNKPGVYRIALSVEGYDDIPFQDFKILEPAEIIEVKQKAQTAPVKVAPTIIPIPPVEPEIIPVIEEETEIIEEEKSQERENENEEDERGDD